ncbi:UBA/THIF-type protein/FAD binding protein [Pseudomonas syringae pv. coriandricola]|uniref:HesA/MoeB/ThiF family protein n=1 Tax=Pseudomonas syringae group TaxID=136849 RepID=UPI000466B5CF|nr:MULTISPECIES: ThiF family adenylyltransferase [Pseudomonas syringae group]RMR34860.1 UBA/THIF-type protein/FAD binding protein [Pseudomonas syringae pv. coriandricola]
MFDFKDARYNRQENMPEWGAQGQERLRNGKVVVVGAGGVKSSMLMILAAAGVGHIRIIEFDTVELSNLNRQILYRTSDIGISKGQAAKKTLQDLNPEIKIELIEKKLADENIDELLEGFSLIVEGGMSPSGRNLVNEYCLKKNKVMVHASAQFSYGYVFTVVPKKRTACFACIFPEDHTREEHTGAVPVNALSTSVAGSLGAAEVIKWLLGYEENMVINRKHYFNSLILSGEFESEIIPRKSDCPVCGKYYD